MKVLVVGGGGREHALAWKLAQSPRVSQIYCAPGNAGIASVAQCLDIGAEDIDGLLSFARDNQVDLTVVGPEAPLCLGITDRFQDEGLLVAGPSQYTAQLEGSKSFAKDLMKDLGVPTADYRVFTDPDQARRYVRQANRPLVLKADGLAAGKGVLLCPDPDQAEAGIEKIMVERAFGPAGDTLVVEEWLQGEEASFLVFSDGHTIVPMPSSQDHKAIGEGDTGPNTGGMGAYSPAPVVTPELHRKIMERIIRPVIQGLADQGHPFKGILYAGLMIDEKGDPQVLEFNVRFGDPECQPLVMRLESDLFELYHLLAQGKLEQAQVKWSDQPTVCVVLAAEGYPGKYKKGMKISGLEDASALEDVMVFHAGTRRRGDDIVTSGGRVLGVTARGRDIGQAIQRAYQACDLISWDGRYLRRDIGYRALARLEQGPRVAVVMGSASDWSVMKSAVSTLEELGITCQAKVLSAHRTPQEAALFASQAAAQGIKVIIAGAGWAAHLAGAMAAQTILPIIGVPIDSSPLNGMDALLATVQMPPGIPVACVAIGKGGAKNAAVLAAQILATSDPELARRLQNQREHMARQVLEASQELT